MDVYVVMSEVNYEGQTLHGIYGSMKAAKASVVAEYPKAKITWLGDDENAFWQPHHASRVRTYFDALEITRWTVET